MAETTTARGAPRKRPPNPFGDFAPSLNFYPSTSHRKVVHRITRSLESSCGMVLLTGEIGIGKTSVGLFVQEEFSDRFAFVLLGNPFLTPAERIETVLDRLGAPDDVPRTMDGFAAWGSTLLREGRPPVLIVDECHLLQRESFSQFQVLSNLREGGVPLVQMLLVGQVEIADRLREPGMEAFNQRIGVRCELEPMSLHDTRRYVEFKLEKADYPSPEVFEKRAVERIWRISGGLPRLINHACAYALDQVTFCGLKRVTPGIVDEVVRDSMYKDLYEVRTKGGAVPWARAAAVAGLLACGAGLLGGVGLLAGWWDGPPRQMVAADVPSSSAPDVASGTSSPQAAPPEAGPAEAQSEPEAAGWTETARAEVARVEDVRDVPPRPPQPVPTKRQAAAPAPRDAPATRTPGVDGGMRVNDIYADDPALAGTDPGALARDASGDGYRDGYGDGYGDGYEDAFGDGDDSAYAAYAEAPASASATGDTYGDAYDATSGMAEGVYEGPAAPGARSTDRAGAVPPDGSVVNPTGTSPIPGPDADAQDARDAADDDPVRDLPAAGASSRQDFIAGIPGAGDGASAPGTSPVRDGAAHPVVGSVTVDAVAWADDDKARIAVLDGVVLREGGELPTGVVLVRIGNKELLLEYQGAIYRLAWNKTE